MTYILILIYTGMSIGAEPKASLKQCMKEAQARIGERAKVIAWDDMNGSNPIPKVATAFCTPGYSGAIQRKRLE